MEDLRKKNATLHGKSDTLYQSIICIYIYLYMYIFLYINAWNLCVLYFAVFQPSKRRPFSIKTKVIKGFQACIYSTSNISWTRGRFQSSFQNLNGHPVCCFSKNSCNPEKHEEMLRNHQGYPRIQFKKNDLSRFLLGPHYMYIVYTNRWKFLHIWKIQV